MNKIALAFYNLKTLDKESHEVIEAFLRDRITEETQEFLSINEQTPAEEAKVRAVSARRVVDAYQEILDYFDVGNKTEPGDEE